jgi:phosphate-selective porin OprO/OprP
MQRMRIFRLLRRSAAITSAAAILVIARPARAQSAGAPAPAPAAQSAPAQSASVYDRTWKKFTDLYVDDANPIIQRVIFTGRFQHDFAWIDADQGELDEWNLRRLRLGPRITFLKTFLFHTEVELNPQENDPTYVRMTDLYVQWSRNARMAVTVGKQGLPFTQEGATSSKELITIDRSNLANNMWFPQEYMPGVSVSGRIAPWNYRVGVYSAGAMNRELGEFDGSMFVLGVVGYDFAKRLGIKEALLTGNYIYQDPDPRNTFTRQLEHVLSANYRMEAARWGFRGDLTRGIGYLGQSSVVGVMAMPFYNITPKLQLVGRYTLVTSDDPKGVRLTTYESRIVTARGNRYDEIYGGANYFFYGHKLKLQTGIQWAEMDDETGDGGEYSGVSWTTGLRVGW